jgi:hypothetical protein
LENNQVQQGDVVVEGVEKIPDGSVEIQRGPDGFVLAEGEVTGHAHRVRDDIKLFRAPDGSMYLKADKPFTLLHEEHKAITWVPGIFRVGRVREMDHLAEMERTVAD